MDYFAKQWGNVETPGLVYPGLSDYQNPYYHIESDWFIPKLKVSDAINTIVNHPQVVCYLKSKPVNVYPGCDADFNYEDIADCPRDQCLIHIWVGGKGTNTGYHFDSPDNILVRFDLKFLDRFIFFGSLLSIRHVTGIDFCLCLRFSSPHIDPSVRKKESSTCCA